MHKMGNKSSSSKFLEVMLGITILSSSFCLFNFVSFLDNKETVLVTGLLHAIYHGVNAIPKIPVLQSF
jgi:hypothetical protein